MPEPESPVTTGKLLCGICGKPLSRYNKRGICLPHTREEFDRYREKIEDQKKQSRAIRSFVQEFHGETTAKEMFQAALKKKGTGLIHGAATEIENYAEALGLLKSASRIFRISVFSIMRLTSTKKKPRVAREVLMYLMNKELEMDLEDIGIFLGYRYLPNVEKSIAYIAHSLLEDEDIILAVDLVREEYRRTEEAA